MNFKIDIDYAQYFEAYVQTSASTDKPQVFAIRRAYRRSFYLRALA